MSTALAGELRLSVAASVADSIREACAAYQKTHPERRCVVNAGGSGTLAKQIEQGAPADLFLPAGRDWLDPLLRQGLLDPASVATLAENDLVFVGRAGAARRLEDLPQLQRIAIGSPGSVPAGAYAVEVLKKAGLYEGLESQGKLVLAQDVRQALVYAERGDVDGAFVYRSDALLARKTVVLFPIDPQLHVPIVYPLALTSDGRRKPEALEFAAYLQSPPVKAILQRHGFSVRE